MASILAAPYNDRSTKTEHKLYIVLYCTCMSTKLATTHKIMHLHMVMWEHYFSQVCSQHLSLLFCNTSPTYTARSMGMKHKVFIVTTSYYQCRGAVCTMVICVNLKNHDSEYSSLNYVRGGMSEQYIIFGRNKALVKGEICSTASVAHNEVSCTSQQI